MRMLKLKSYEYPIFKRKNDILKIGAVNEILTSPKRYFICLPSFLGSTPQKISAKLNLNKGGRHGRVVTGGDSCPRGREFLSKLKAPDCK